MGMFIKQNQDQSPDNSTTQQANDYNSAPAQTAVFNPFEKIGNSTPNEGGVYPDPGVYPLLCVSALKMIKSRKGEDIFIAEFEILQSEVESRPAGTNMSQLYNFKHDAAPGNVRLLLAAIMGAKVNDVDAEGSQFAVSDKNPCRGRLVRMTATVITTKAGNPFTLCSFSAIGDDVQAQAAELRHAAGFDASTPF